MVEQAFNYYEKWYWQIQHNSPKVTKNHFVAEHWRTFVGMSSFLLSILQYCAMCGLRCSLWNKLFEALIKID